jgi:hypothetical protein
MKKFLPLILTIFLLSACGNAVSETTPETFSNTTLTTGPDGLREEPAYTDNDTFADPEPAPEPSNPWVVDREKPFAENGFTANYAAAGNAALGGLLAFDDYHIYYANMADGANLYRKAYGDTTPGIKLADSDGNKSLRNICVWGDYVYFNTPDEDSFCVYKIPKNGGSPEKVLDNAGGFFYIVDDVMLYTLPDSGLFAERMDGKGEVIKIDDKAAFVNFANGEITYSDYENIKVFDLRTMEYTLVLKCTGINAMIRTEDKITYQVDYRAGESLYSEIYILDADSHQSESIGSQINFSVPEDDQYFSGQEYVPTSFNYYDGLFYFNILRDYSKKGFSKRVTYSRDPRTLDSMEVLDYYYDVPFAHYQELPENLLLAAYDGLYEYNQQGFLERVPVPVEKEPDTSVYADLNETEREYLAAANNMFSGQCAFDDSYVY